MSTTYRVNRRYVQWVADPVGDFADEGPGYYVLEDREDAAGTSHGVIVEGPFDTSMKGSLSRFTAMCQACAEDKPIPEADLSARIDDPLVASDQDAAAAIDSAGFLCRECCHTAPPTPDAPCICDASNLSLSRPEFHQEGCPHA